MIDARNDNKPSDSAAPPASMRDQLVGTSGAAEILGVEPREIKRLVRDRPFPEPVAWLEGRRAWLRRDIEDLRDGREQADREPGELQDQILNALEAATLLGISERHLRRCVQDARWDLVPPPGGRIGLALFWWRSALRDWRGRHAHAKVGE